MKVHVVCAVAALSTLACGSSDDHGTPTSTSGGNVATGGNTPSSGGSSNSGGTTSSSGGTPESGGTSSGGGAGDSGNDTRPFALGFAPFPHDVTLAAQDFMWSRLAADGDLYAFHSTEGVPWVEAGTDAPVSAYGASLREKWEKWRSEAEAHPDHAVYVGLTPLNDARNDLAPYWAANEQMPLPAPWNGHRLDSAEVKAAYLSYCKRAVEYFHPDYLGIGLEVNLLAKNASARFAEYLTLHLATYRALKVAYPDLPVFVTFTAVDLLEGWTDAPRTTQVAALDALIASTDLLALSFYPYMSRYLTEPLPAGFFQQLASMARDKPLAIAESGYPAQRTEIPSYDLIFEGTPEKQRAWIDSLLGAAQEHRMPFVVNWVLRDYDALLAAAGLGDASAVWRDTGLYDEAGTARPALDTWRAALSEKRAP